MAKILAETKAKADAFYALHRETFIIPNPWDRGSARILAHMGFKALATTSMGYAFSIGQRDNSLTREQTLANAADIVAGTDLPVSADLENGFGDRPEDAADTIRLSEDSGIVGGSIEDATGDGAAPIYDIGLAKERVQAAVEAARALPYKFTLTARAENFLWGRPDLADTIKRLQAYQDAGADVLYAPGLRTREDIASLVSSVDRPVNVVMGLVGAPLSLEELSKIGVRRISVGSSLQRAALGAFLRAAEEMSTKGTFTYAVEAASPNVVTPIFDAYLREI
ncbi:MAG TPA: isocitrate lyase/phosphoenolpyruvate mutase family protein [Rhizomicrobium sp.]|jgi:2-methylisocitrate lyase-like PEP mutase family enzyme